MVSSMILIGVDLIDQVISLSDFSRQVIGCVLSHSCFMAEFIRF